MGVGTGPDSLIARGNTSDVYAVGADAVVKVPRPEVPRHWTGIEARLATAVNEAGLPTPMVLDVIEIDGRSAIVFERIKGPSMAEHLAQHPEESTSMARAMADIQIEFQHAPAPADLPVLRDRVAGKIDVADGLDAAEKAMATDLLNALPDGRSICHGDVHPGNILIGESGLSVIDWFDAASGPLVADVVRSSLLVRTTGAPAATPPHLAGVPAATLGAFHDAYLERMLPVLNDDVVSTLAWEVVRSVGRLSEAVPEGTGDMLDIWRRRCDLTMAPDTPLAAVLVARAG